jgi:hypothetical protein
MGLPFKYKLLLAIIGAVLGIPTSYNGYVWMQTKLAGQHLNCITDAYEADYTNAEAARAAGEALDSCQAQIDRRKGSIQFVRDQARRARH